MNIVQGWALIFGLALFWVYLFYKTRIATKWIAKYLLKNGKGHVALTFLQKRHEWSLAIETAQRIGDYARAAELCLFLKQPVRAAKFLALAGQKRQAAKLFAEHGHLKKSARIYKELHALPELARFLLKQNKIELAVKVLFIEKDYEGAFDILYESDYKIEASIVLCTLFQKLHTQENHAELERIGQKLSEILLELGQWKRCSRVLIEIKKYLEAAECLARNQDYNAAAEICMRIGEPAKAEEYYLLAGNQVAALKIRGERYASEGDVYKAIDCFVKAKEFVLAGDIYCDLQETKLAAEYYELGGAIALAATFFQHSGEYLHAGHLFERIGDLESAAKSFRMGELLDEELRIRIAQDNFLEAAKIYQRQQKWDLALQFLSRIPSDSKDFREAIALQGNILVEQGNVDDGIPLIEKSLAVAGNPKPFDLENYYMIEVTTPGTWPANSVGQILNDTISKADFQEEWIPDAKSMFETLSSKGSSQPQQKKDIRYLPIKEIGRGGMGIVYTALDTALDRTVALKILPTSLQTNNRAVHTFLREARLAASMNHPNVVTVYDTSTQIGSYYIAMELIDGETLKRVIYKRPRLPYRTILRYLNQILLGVQHAHSKNIIHRDLTSNNIMVTQEDSIKIMDFGLAKVNQDIHPDQSILGGTPSYMSPEQVKGGTIDHRTDIYTLGITLFEMTLRRLPFIEGDLSYHHVHSTPPKPRDLESSVPSKLEEVILRCMEKDPANRFQSAKEIQEYLDL